MSAFRNSEQGSFCGSPHGCHRPQVYASLLIGQCCHGKDETKVYAELCQIVEEWIEILEGDGHTLPEPLAAKKFSGTFVLRLEPAMHRRLAARALAAGESLNSYCATALVKLN